MNKRAGDRAERRFLRRVAVNAVDHQHHHRGAEQIIVERAEELGDENRQEAAGAQEVGGVLHRAGRVIAASARAPQARAVLSTVQPRSPSPSQRGDADAAQSADPVADLRGADPGVPAVAAERRSIMPSPSCSTASSASTDYFDGYLARAQGQISRLGQFLDPIADKIMVAAVIMMLVSSAQQ